MYLLYKRIGGKACAIMVVGSLVALNDRRHNKYNAANNLLNQQLKM